MILAVNVARLWGVMLKKCCGCKSRENEKLVIIYGILKERGDFFIS
jgi:hypothetical protein